MSDYTPHPLVPKGSSKTKGPTPAHTITQTSVKQYTHEEAQSYALQAFQNAIGRAPSSQELDAFMTSFNAGQNPSTTSTHYGVGGNSISTTTTGGTDPSMLAQNIAEQNPEYAGYQKATTYFDAMLSALQGPMGGSV
jgi:hypothetical protein